MAKFIIEFDDYNPEDVVKIIRVVKSTDMACVLFEISGNIKRSIENKIDSGEIKSPQQASDEIFLEISNLMESKNLNIDELLN